jgi:hypothetical protein
MKAKVEKRLKSSTKNEKESKNVTFFFYRDIFTGLEAPMSPKGIERLATEVVEWAQKDPEALKLSQFYYSKGIARKMWYEWCHKFPELEQASNEAKYIIGDRRETGALKNKLNTGMVHYSMSFYDPEWKEESVRRAALKEGSSDGAKTNFTVVVDAIPESPVVPKRKKEEEQ